MDAYARSDVEQERFSNYARGTQAPGSMFGRIEAIVREPLKTMFGGKSFDMQGRDSSSFTMKLYQSARRVTRRQPSTGTTDTRLILRDLIPEDEQHLKGLGEYLSYEADESNEITWPTVLSGVECLGKVPHDRVSALYRSHDLFVFPSIWQEPFGLTPLEAMASGIPVISTVNGGHGEFVQHKINAFVFKEGDADMLADQSSEGRLLAEKKKSEEAHRANQEGKASPPQGKNSEEETKQIEELKRRDREVRAHEMAHLMAAGALASGGPSYEFQKGPDGKQYAVGGEVKIDTSPVEGDPEATMRKAARIQAAANAPADPSSQDRSVASQAAAMAVRAQAELAEYKKEEQDNEVDQSEAHNNPYDKKAESGSIIDLVA